MSDFMTRHSVSSAQRGLMPALWKRCPRTAILNGHLDKGWGFIDDFHVGHYDSTDTTADPPLWKVDNTTNGSVAYTDYKGGWIALDSEAAGGDQGVQIQRSDGSGGEVFLPNANSEIFFECRIYPSDLGTLGSADSHVQAFLGLASRDTTVMASGDISASDYAGFLYEDGYTSGNWYIAGSDGTQDANDTGVSVTDGSTVKLGFWIYKNEKIVPYINGVAYPSKKITASASMPSASMTPTLVCMGESGVDSIIKVDYVACFQTELLDDPIS